MTLEIVLDKENEEFVLETGWDIAVPVDFTLEDDLLRIVCFPSVADAVRCWAGAFGGDPFAEEALRALWKAIAPWAKECGYQPERHRERWGIIYRCKAVALAPQESTRRLSAADEDHNQTTYDLEMTVEDGRIAFGTLVGGKVVSVAVSHSAPEAGAVVELGVETCVLHRKKGYAASNLAMATEALLQEGCIPEYRCYFDNIASAKSAEKAGYYQAGKYYYYVLRRKPQKNGRAQD